MSNIKPHIRISATAVSSTFVDDIRAIIEQGKQQAYMSVNASMIETYWHIGERIVEEEQQGSKRAEYGAQIIDFLAEKLADEYGESYSPRYLRSFRQFYALFPDFNIWKSRFPNLTWTHIAYRSQNREGDPPGCRADGYVCANVRRLEAYRNRQPYNWYFAL